MVPHIFLCRLSPLTNGALFEILEALFKLKFIKIIVNNYLPPSMLFFDLIMEVIESLQNYSYEGLIPIYRNNNEMHL